MNLRIISAFLLIFLLLSVAIVVSAQTNSTTTEYATSSTTAAPATTSSTAAAAADNATPTSSMSGDVTSDSPPPLTTMNGTEANSSADAANVFIIKIMPILAAGESVPSFSNQAVSASQPALREFRAGIRADLARLLGVQPVVKELTVEPSGAWLVTVDFGTQTMTDITNAADPSKRFSVSEYLKSKSSQQSAPWMTNTTSALKAAGDAANPPFRVQGAAMVSVTGRNEPQPTCESAFCFMPGCDCVMSAVVAGILVILAIVLITCICSCLCGKKDDPKAAQREIERQQSVYEMQIAKQDREIAQLRRTDSIRKASISGPSLAEPLARRGSLVQPVVEVPKTTPPVAPKYEIDNDL